LRQPDRDEPARLGFLVDQLVGVLRRSEPVTHHPHRAVALVDADVIEGRRVAHPHGLAGGGMDLLVQIAPAGEVPDLDGEELRSLGIGRPGQKAVIRRLVGIVQVEERMVPALFVAV
jgi:hypothetical protein